MLNLIVFYSIIYLYVFGIKCNGYGVSLVKNCEEHGILRLAHDYRILWKATWGAHENNWRVRGISRLACDLATHKGLSKSTDNWNSMCFLSFLTHTIKTHITCENCKKSFKEKTLEIHWRVGDCNSSIMYTLLLVFFTLFPFNFHILWEELSPNTIHTHSKCRKLTWSIWEALGSC